MDKKTLNTLAVAGGMALVLLGRKVEGLTLFGKGVYSLEKIYRDNHPELEPGIKPRWEKAVEFYEETHQEETNRLLHRIGIPMILGGAVGLFAARPYKKNWNISAAFFALGWALNIIGHAKFEKKAPAFTDDPLSFIAGPVWDVKQFTTNKLD